MHLICSAKEKHCNIMASEYIIKNIGKAKFFIDFFDSVEEKEVFLGRFEIKDDNTKKFLSFLVDYNVKNYFVSSLFFENDCLFALGNNLSYKGIKIIKNKNNDSVDAIFKLFFGFDNSAYDRYQRVYFIINTVFISKDFLVYLLEDSKEFYKIDSKMIEIINSIIQFVQNDKYKFFLISCFARMDYIMKLNLINAYNPAISFMLKPKYVIFRNSSDWRVLLEDLLSMEYLNKYLEKAGNLYLYIENIMNHFGGDVKENTKILVLGIFSKLLSFYIKEFGFPELPNVKIKAPSYKVNASKRYLGEDIKHIRKKNRFWALFLEAVRNKYFPSILKGPSNAIVEKFRGKITLIESVLLYNRFKTFKINAYIINEPSSNSEFYQKFLEIEIREELYAHSGQEEIVIEISFELKEFNSYFYSKKKLKAFVEDVAEALVKLGIISTTNDLYFLARIEKARQLYK